MARVARRCLALVLALWLSVLCGAAVGRPVALHTVFEDDDQALFAGPAGLARFIDELRWLGVDQLRISAEWKLEVPDPDARRPPAGFDAASADAYTGAGTALLDRAVRAARAAGLGVIVDPAFSAPLWATSDGGAGGAGWFNTNINVQRAAQWEAMLARRYSGSYTPPGASAPLPRVTTFTLWNEPNNENFLKPQWQGAVPVSADWYRQLVQTAYPAIKRVAPWAQVLIGNTSYSGSDIGSSGMGVAPLTFIRRLACVDAALRPVSDGSCASFRMVPADGYAHHPYERDAPPWVASNGRGRGGWAQMGDLGRLEALLARLVAMHRLAPGARNLWLTEQGYESNAELVDKPWTEEQQAQLNAASEYLAWRAPYVSSFSQFLLRDTLVSRTLALRAATADPSALVSGAWTTGLVREDGRVKPALSMFRSPVVARVVAAPAVGSSGELTSLVPGLGGPRLEVWGRVRPARAPVAVGVLVGGVPVGGGMTDADGAFDVEVGLSSPAFSGFSGAGRSGPSEVRFTWAGVGVGHGTSPATVPWAFAPPGGWRERGPSGRRPGSG